MSLLFKKTARRKGNQQNRFPLHLLNRIQTIFEKKIVQKLIIIRQLTEMKVATLNDNNNNNDNNDNNNNDNNTNIVVAAP